MILVLACEFNVQGLAQQHPGNTDQGNEYKYSFNAGLAFEHVFVATVQWFGVLEQHHVDEHNQNGRSTAGCIGLEVGFGSVLNPLEEHHEDHVAEQQNQEQNLWQKFQENAGGTFEVNKVNNRHADTKDHVNNTGNDGQFHFVGIQKDNLVVSHLPDGIHTQGINTLNMVFWIQLQRGICQNGTGIIAYGPGRTKDIH